AEDPVDEDDGGLLEVAHGGKPLKLRDWKTFEWGHSPFLVVVQARSGGPIGLRGFEVPVGIKGDVLNCCGKMPSLRRAGLPGSFNLSKQFRMSNLPTWRTPLEQVLGPGVAALS